MKREDIYPGYFLVLKNGTVYIIIGTPYGNLLMPIDSCKAMTRLNDLYNSDLSPKEDNISPIVEIRDNNHKVIWVPNTEMTIKEIEIALNIFPGTLRIKK